MARRKLMQTNFSSGELAPDLGMRQDTEQYANGAKSLRNRRCLIGGGTKRRPGSGRFAELLATGRAKEFIVNETTKYILVFSAGRVDAFQQDTATKILTAAGGVTGAPWTGNIWREMDYEQAANTAFLTHAATPPQRLVRTGAAAWTLANLSFFVGHGGRIEQPYFKIADPAITLTPSARTGSITVTASAAAFVADHVGKRIRILAREILITAFTNSTTVTGTVQEELRPTYRVTLATAPGQGSTGYSVDDVVVGSTSGIKGIVTAVVDSANVDVLLTSSIHNFITASPFEKLVGPNTAETISASALHTPEAATREWDEQLFSSIWGYPACVALHRNRLLFGGHPAVPNALIGSKLNNLYSFDVGDGSDGDGIFETIGDAGASTIRQLHSAEQLLVLSDHGPYYVPEGTQNAFRPSSIAFFPFGSPWPVTATAKARGFDDGVLFTSGSLIIKARPTGDLSRAWVADDDVSLIASHLLSAPFDLAVTSNFAGRTERYAVLINLDGTLAVLQLVEAQKIRNLTPWDTGGKYTSVAALGGDLYFTSERSINGATRYFLEHFDQNLTLDCAITYADLPALNTGVPIDFGTTTVHVTAGSGDGAIYLGTWPLVMESPPPGPYTAGLYYDSAIETLPPVTEGQDGSKAGEEMSICKTYLNVRGSQRFRVAGYTLPAYQVTDDVGAPPPVRNGWIEFEPSGGWVREPTILINQPDPLPLDVLAIKNVVNY